MWNQTTAKRKMKMQMKIDKLSFDGKNWADAKPIRMDNDIDMSKVTGGYASARYRKKPVEIDAIRWTGRNESDVLEFCDGTAWIKDGALRINTLEGLHIASVGDYIIRGVKGECYPCKADIFDATYERVKKDVISHG